MAHHTVNGCNLNAGYLLGSGTQSGPNEGEHGSLLEISNAGVRSIVLPNGEQRTLLEDGDSIVLNACVEKEGVVRIGFGQVSSVVLPALKPNQAWLLVMCLSCTTIFAKAVFIVCGLR